MSEIPRLIDLIQVGLEVNLQVAGLLGRKGAQENMQFYWGGRGATRN